MLIKRVINSSLFKSSGIYTVSSLINAAIPFLFIPILTRIFSTEEYGIVSMIAIIINVVTPFIGVSAQGAVHRRYFEEGKESEFPIYVGNAFVLLILSSVFFFLTFYFLGSFISLYTSVPIKWLYVVLIISICQFITLILLTIWQAKVKPLKYGVLQISQSILNICFSLFFIYELHYGVEGRVFGQLVAVVIAAIFSLTILVKFKYVKFEYNKKYLFEILKFSLPLIPHTLGGLIIAFTDRILITNLFGVNETGVYTVAYQIGSILNIVNVSFINAYVPWLYNNLNKNDHRIKIKIVKFTYFYFFILLIITVLASVLLPFVIELFVGKSFLLAESYTVWIILGYAFNGMYLMVAGFIFYAKKTAILSKITIVTAVLNIPVCYMFLKNYGPIGAAFSMSIVYGISFIYSWYLSNRVFKMPWFNFKAND